MSSFMHSVCNGLIALMAMALILRNRIHVTR